MKYDSTTLEMSKDLGLKLATDDLISDTSEVYSFNCPPIDIPFGGGIVPGRIYEFIGSESAGKTTLALQVTITIANWIKNQKDENYVILWIESESTIDKERALFMGCPMNKFQFFETDIFEHGRDKMRDFLNKLLKKNGKLRALIVWDTIAATSTLNEKNILDVEEDFDVRAEVSAEDKKKKSNPAGLTEKPKLIKGWLRDIGVDLANTHSTLIVVNQMITQIGKYGAPLDSGGGMGLRHYASVRAKISREEDGPETVEKDGVKRIRSTVNRIEFKKNKITGYTDITTYFILDKEAGIDTFETTLLFLKKNKLIPAVAGGWCTWKIPEGYTDPTKLKDGKPYKPGQIEIKFQRSADLKKLIFGEEAEPHLFKEAVPAKYPHLADWMDYLVYAAYAKSSPLTKAKLISKVWEYEVKFFGERISVLSEKEREVATMRYKELMDTVDKEDAETEKKLAREAKAKGQEVAPKAKTAPKVKGKSVEKSVQQ